MKIRDARFVDDRYISLVESQVRQFGPPDEMTIHYIVAEPFSQREIDIWNLLIETEKNGMKRLAAMEHLSDMLTSMTPFVDKLVIRAAVWQRDRLHIIYIDPNERRTIHRSSVNYPDPTTGNGADPGTNDPMNPGV